MNAEKLFIVAIVLLTIGAVLQIVSITMRAIGV